MTGNITGTDSIVGTKVVALCNIKERSFLGVTSSIMVLFSTNQTAVVRNNISIEKNSLAFAFYFPLLQLLLFLVPYVYFLSFFFISRTYVYS